MTKQVIIRRFGGPEVVEVVDSPDPTPGPGEVVVKAHTMGVGWPDILIRDGRYPWAPPLPITLGQEMSGTIAAVGPDVDTLPVGMPVYISSREMGFQSGCYDTMRLTPVHAVRPLPEGIDLEAAAGLGYLSLAWALLFETQRRFDLGSVVVVGAAGGLGAALTQVARAYGIEVIGTVSSPTKADYASANGATHTIDRTTQNELERVLELTDGKGVDMVIDHVGGKGMADRLRMLGRFGTLVSCNAVEGDPGPSLFSTMTELVERVPSWCYFSMHVYEDDPEGRRRILDPVIDLMANGRIATPIAARFPIDDIHGAHEMLESRRNLGRIVLTP